MFTLGFVIRTISDPRGSVRTNAGRLGALRLLDAQRANAVPRSGEADNCIGLPLGKVLGRSQGFRHGRLVACRRLAPIGRHLLPQLRPAADGQPTESHEPTEAEAARPPKGGSFCLGVGLCRAHYVLRWFVRGKREEPIGLQLAGAVCELPTVATCGHRGPL